jgi:hypothetical protein
MIPVRDNQRNGEGVSEAIGFLLIFAMVIVGIGLVTLYGYPMLMQQQTSADEKIMEKNMIVLQNDAKSIMYKSVPYKETSLKTGSGVLSVVNQTDPSTTKFDVYDANNIHYVSPYPLPMGDLRYVSESSDTDISLQNGAVVKRQHVESGSVLLAAPRWFYDSKSNILVINFITMNSSAPMAMTGIGTVQMELGKTYYDYNTTTTPPIYVKYIPDPTIGGQDYSTAWNNYLHDNMGMKSLGGGVYEFDPQPDTPMTPFTLVIREYDVMVDTL